jgi:hypothetical protein
MLPFILDTPTLLMAPIEEKITKLEVVPKEGVHCAWAGSSGYKNKIIPNPLNQLKIKFFIC